MIRTMDLIHIGWWRTTTMSEILNVLLPERLKSLVHSIERSPRDRRNYPPYYVKVRQTRPAPPRSVKTSATLRNLYNQVILALTFPHRFATYAYDKELSIRHQDFKLTPDDLFLISPFHSSSHSFFCCFSDGPGPPPPTKITDTCKGSQPQMTGTFRLA